MKEYNDYEENIRSLEHWFSKFLEVPMDFVKLNKKDKVVIIGSGSSFHQAQYAALLLRYKCNIEAYAITPLDFVRLQKQKITTIMISQGGDTHDIIEACNYAKSLKCTIIGFTAKKQSPLTKIVDYSYYFEPDNEIILARTCGVLNGFYIIYRFCMQQQEKVPLKAKEVLTLIKNREKNKYKLLSKNYVILANGYLMPAAKELALKLTEVGFIGAQAYDIKNFAHGPTFRAIDKKKIGIIICKENKDNAQFYNTIEEIFIKNGNEVHIITSSHTGPESLFDVLVAGFDASLSLHKKVHLNLGRPPYLEQAKRILNENINPGGI